MEHLKEIVLPSINGKTELGIAAGVDPVLDDSLRLPILSGQGVTKGKAACYAASWAHMHDTADQKDFSAAAAAAVVMCGWTSRTCGDTVSATTPDPAVSDYYTQHKAAIDAATAPQKVSAAATVVMSTKLNWFSTNHHTGSDRDKLSGYVEKVWRATMDDEISEGNVSAVHTAGHWASTKLVLGSLGHPFRPDAAHPENGARSYITLPKPDYEGIPVVATKDAQLRIGSNPAGTAEVFVVHAAAKQMMCHESIFLFPDISDLDPYPDAVEEVESDPLVFHVGSQFLVGKKTKVIDGLAPCIGRTGAWLNVYRKSGTLVKSPKFSDYQAANDFSDSYMDDLKKLKQAATLPEAAHQQLLVQTKLTKAGFERTLARFSRAPTGKQAAILALLTDDQEN